MNEVLVSDCYFEAIFILRWILERKIAFVLLALGMIILLSANAAAQAPPGKSFEFSYDFFPYKKLSDPEPGTFFEDIEVRVQKFNFDFSYPLVFARGKTVMVNSFGYQQLQIDYKNWEYDEGGGEATVDRLHSLSYTMFLRRVINDTWSMAFLLNPGFATDFEGALVLEDFSLQFGAIFTKQFSPRFAFGFGAVYSTQFGHPIPLPALSFQWNNGSNFRANVILPVNMELWYDASERLDLGILMKIDGDEFHVDPEIYGYDNPNFRQTDAMIGPAAEIKVASWMSLNLYSGYTYLRMFEFYNADDELAAYDPENGLFFRAGLRFER